MVLIVSGKLGMPGWRDSQRSIGRCGGPTVRELSHPACPNVDKESSGKPCGLIADLEASQRGSAGRTPASTILELEVDKCNA